MVRTVTIGAYISIQGLWVRDLSDGRRIVRVGQQEYIGRPVTRALAEA